MPDGVGGCCRMVNMECAVADVGLLRIWNVSDCIAQTVRAVYTRLRMFSARREGHVESTRTVLESARKSRALEGQHCFATIKSVTVSVCKISFFFSSRRRHTRCSGD